MAKVKKYKVSKKWMIKIQTALDSRKRINLHVLKLQINLWRKTEELNFRMCVNGKDHLHIENLWSFIKPIWSQNFSSLLQQSYSVKSFMVFQERSAPTSWWVSVAVASTSKIKTGKWKINQTNKVLVNIPAAWLIISPELKCFKIK